MKTRVVPVSAETKAAAAASPAFGRVLRLRMMSPEDWIECHSSGTLRKARRIGMAWKSQHREERPAWEFGYSFEMLPSTRLTVGPAIAASDCKAVTELGWFLDRMQARSPFVEDIFEAKYIHAQCSLGKHGTDKPREGLAIAVHSTSAPWIPGNYLVFAFVSVLQRDGSYSRALNPC